MHLYHVIEKFDDVKFHAYFSKFYTKLMEMETIKYLPPKFSKCFPDLTEYLGLN